MRKHLVQTTLVLLGAAILASGMAGSAQAQQFPKTAKRFSVWMARAFDECTPGTLSVLGSGVPNSGCVASNTSTDSSTSMNLAKVLLTSAGRIKLFGRGFTFGDVVRVRLELRVTRRNVLTKHPASTNATVTFSDVTIDCPPSPDAFAVRPNGAIVASTDLQSCLSPYGNLATGSPNPNNIEILRASIVNAVSGLEIARSGIVR